MTIDQVWLLPIQMTWGKKVSLLLTMVYSLTVIILEGDMEEVVSQNCPTSPFSSSGRSGFT